MNANNSVRFYIEDICLGIILLMEKRCDSHKDCEVSHVCLNCKQFLCIYCTLEHSSLHQTATLADLATKIIQQFNYKPTNGIQADNKAMKEQLKKKTIGYWSKVKQIICNNIDDLTTYSLTFIEGLSMKERNINLSDQTIKRFINLFNNKKYYYIYKNENNLKILSDWFNEHQKSKDKLNFLLNNFPLPDLGLLKNSLLKLMQDFYTSINAMQSSNYGVYLEDNSLNFIYMPSYVDSIQFNKPIHNPGVVQVDNTVYLIGGNNGRWNSPHVNTTYSVTLNFSPGRAVVLSKASMASARAWHGALALKDLWIYAIGGYNNKEEALNQCEKYMIKNDKWIRIPALNKPRWGMSLTLFNDRLIYAFFGVDSRSLSYSIEVMDCLDEERGWKIRDFEGNTHYRRHSHVSFQLSNTEIYIFGGNTGANPASKCLIYNLEHKKISIACECECYLHLAYYRLKPKINGYEVYKTDKEKKIAIYDRLKRYWILTELYNLGIMKEEK